jgi:hypothetical protein
MANADVEMNLKCVPAVRGVLTYEPMPPAKSALVNNIRGVYSGRRDWFNTWLLINDKVAKTP